MKSINPEIVALDFPARGPIETDLFLAEAGVAHGEKFPFDGFLGLHDGNAQGRGMQANTFSRQVLAMCLQPDMLNNPLFSQDAKSRAKELIKAFKSLGCYTESAGNAIVTKSIAEFISRRDGVKAEAKNVMVFNGASEALSSYLLTLCTKSKNPGVLAPSPQFPQYAARIALAGGHSVTYDLDESTGWQISEEALRRSIDQAKSKGVDVRGIIAINPGNPTGALFTRESIEAIYKVAYEKGLVVLANEGNQDVVLDPKKKFVSFRKVLSELPAEVSKSVELISFHSCSQGLYGEAGLRGGYAEMVNLDPKVQQEIYKLKTIYLSSSTAGQVMLELMARPPTKETASDLTVSQYNKEVEHNLKSLRAKADVLQNTLSTMKGFSLKTFEAGYHAFARLDLPKSFVAEAKTKGESADLHYCRQVLFNTGVALAPGSTFKANGNFVRCSILGENLTVYASKLEEWRNFHQSLLKKFAN